MSEVVKLTPIYRRNKNLAQYKKEISVSYGMRVKITDIFVQFNQSYQQQYRIKNDNNSNNM